MLYSSAMDIFRAVMKRGSFIGAADELGISGAAVSKQIKRLEQRLNLVLFYRTTRSVVPTEAAQRLADLLLLPCLESPALEPPALESHKRLGPRLEQRDELIH